MSEQLEPVSVTILDREYRIACPTDEQDALHASARLLDHRMQAIRDSGKVIGIERIAVMAALNITNELLQFQSEKDDYIRTVDVRVQHLQDKIQQALDQEAVLPA